MSVRISTRVFRRAMLRAHYETYELAMKRDHGHGKTLVPGVGDPCSPLVIIGEAPGEHEDAHGLPFVGRSGRFLTELLGGIGFGRDDVFITNLVKYRPDNNKDPEQTEAAAATELLRMELDILKPKLCVPMGRFACRLWWPNPNMQMLAGSMWVKRDQVIVPMYHPSWALRSGPASIQLMKDHMQVVAEVLESTGV